MEILMETLMDKSVWVIVVGIAVCVYVFYLMADEFYDTLLVAIPTAVGCSFIISMGIGTIVFNLAFNDMTRNLQLTKIDPAEILAVALSTSRLSSVGAMILLLTAAIGYINGLRESRMAEGCR